MVQFAADELAGCVGGTDREPQQPDATGIDLRRQFGFLAGDTRTFGLNQFRQRLDGGRHRAVVGCAWQRPVASIRSLVAHGGAI
jgi:hypothetical protein